MLILIWLYRTLWLRNSYYGIYGLKIMNPTAVKILVDIGIYYICVNGNEY
jgi:hypothetical protein